MHIIAAKAVCFKEALSDEFKAYQHQVVKNAAALSKALINNGFRIVSGGTDNHLMLLDLTTKGLTGKEAEKMLDEIGVTVNKNTIPFETTSPFITSGIRIGTPAVTSRGMKEEDMEQISEIISITLDDFEANKAIAIEKVNALCDKYPLYK